MIPNKKCMKDILQYISDNAKIKVENMAYHDIRLSSMNVTMLLEEISKEGKYKIEEIAYNFMQCYNDKLVYANIVYKDSKTVQSVKSDILGLTLKGIEFINQ